MLDTLFKVLVRLEKDFILKDGLLKFAKFGDNETLASPMLLVVLDLNYLIHLV